MSLKKYKKLDFSLKNTKTTFVSQKYTKSIVSSHDCKSPLSLAATTGCPLCKWAPDQNWATFWGGQHIIQTESLLWISSKSLSIHDQWPLIGYVFRNGKGLSYAMGFRQIYIKSSWNHSSPKNISSSSQINDLFCFRRAGMPLKTCNRVLTMEQWDTGWVQWKILLLLKIVGIKILSISKYCQY